VLPDIVSNTTCHSKGKNDSQEEGETANAVFLLKVLFEPGARVCFTQCVELLAAFAGGEGNLAVPDVGVVLFYVLVFTDGRGVGECEARDGLAVAACIALVVVCTIGC
jgi:hypothetical protein